MKLQLITRQKQLFLRSEDSLAGDMPEGSDSEPLDRGSVGWDVVIPKEIKLMKLKMQMKMQMKMPRKARNLTQLNLQRDLLVIRASCCKLPACLASATAFRIFGCKRVWISLERSPHRIQLMRIKESTSWRSESHAEHPQSVSKLVITTLGELDQAQPEYQNNPPGHEHAQWANKDKRCPAPWVFWSCPMSGYVHIPLRGPVLDHWTII